MLLTEQGIMLRRWVFKPSVTQLLGICDVIGKYLRKCIMYAYFTFLILSYNESKVAILLIPILS